MLLKNLNQKRILFAESGIDSWNSAKVASAILRRLERMDTNTITINRFDLVVLYRMAVVLGTSCKFISPFQSGIWDQQAEVEASVLVKSFN